jgi:hypothetical protein
MLDTPIPPLYYYLVLGLQTHRPSSSSFHIDFLLWDFSLHFRWDSSTMLPIQRPLFHHLAHFTVLFLATTFYWDAFYVCSYLPLLSFMLPT